MIGFLVIFKNGGYDSGQCQCTSVKRMCQFFFSILVFNPKLEAVGLVGFKIGLNPVTIP